jgi:hypothetical protein
MAVFLIGNANQKVRFSPVNQYYPSGTSGFLPANYYYTHHKNFRVSPLNVMGVTKFVFIT